MQYIPEDAIEMVGSREIEQRLKILCVEQADTEANLRRGIRDRRQSRMLGYAVRSIGLFYR